MVWTLFSFLLPIVLLSLAQSEHLGCVAANNVYAHRLSSALAPTAPDAVRPARLYGAQQAVAADRWTRMASACPGNMLELSRAAAGHHEVTQYRETPSRLRVTSFFLLGLAKYDAGAYDDALSLWAKARTYKDTVILSLLPDIDTEDALIRLVRLIAPLEFSSNRGRISVAQLMERSGHQQEAAEIWGQAVAYETETTAMHWWYLGESRRLGGDPYGALDAYQRGIPLTSDTEMFLQRITLLNMELKDWAAAEQAANSWRTTSQNKSDALLASGRIAQNQQRYSEAEHWYVLASKAAPARGDALYHLGHLRFLQQRYPDAVGYLTTAIELRPDLDGAYALLILSYLRQDLRSDAERVLEQAEEHVPAFSQLYPGLRDTILSGDGP